MGADISASALAAISLGVDRELNKILNLYYIYWFDSAYPNGEYSGYQDMLRQYIHGIPYKTENDATAAIRFLNTSLACTRYIAVVTGLKKKRVVTEIVNSPAVQYIYILKSVPAKVKKWSSIYKKVKVYRTFAEMLPEIRKIVHPFESVNKVKVDTKNSIEYLAHPNPVTMAQQTVDALRDEKAQQDDQLIYKTLYSLTLKYIIDWHTSENLIRQNDLAHYFEKMKLSYSLEHICEDYINLLKFSIKVDQCPLIVSGITIDEIRQLLNDQPFIFARLPEILHGIEPDADLSRANRKQLKELHTVLVSAIASELSERAGRAWTRLYFPAMCLGDVDFCLKMFMQSVLNAGKEMFEDLTHDKFAPTLSQASIASDVRVISFNEVIEKTKEKLKKEGAEPCMMDRKEIEVALDNCAIRNVLVFDFNTTKHKDLFAPLISKIKRKCRVYKLVQDFYTDFEGHAELRNKTVYAVIPSDFPKGDYEQLLNIFVRESITPLLVIYVPDSQCQAISKAMFKNKWIITTMYTESFDSILDYMNDVEVDIVKDMEYYGMLYDDFGKTLASVGSGGEEKGTGEGETDFEVLSTVNKSVFSGLVEELSLGTKLMGSLHYYMWKQYRELESADVYWKAYAPLFGVIPKKNNILDINFGKNLLRAYTLQDKPPFYKMLNEVFRRGNSAQISKYRAFYVTLHDLAKKGILKHYCGTVFRGTYFNELVLQSLKRGQTIFSSCFTSTSKSPVVAADFARKTGRNVMLEIELHPRGSSNIDIHEEKMSIYPEEQEVLLLPFTKFEVMSVGTEGKLTTVKMVEMLQQVEAATIKGIDYHNCLINLLCLRDICCSLTSLWLSLIHICRCRRYAVCRSRWSPYH
eukprot:TRINITY_DN10639_c0_g1_i4.p1 TRINITY_DN10639_c0_g1~~TRINITY_DN10639_c0_g1_i4.p1  ORF type:complete len:863 (-),score=194.43 TRINITY_DN10639_c0_g1_i4:27-2615(-)